MESEAISAVESLYLEEMGKRKVRIYDECMLFIGTIFLWCDTIVEVKGVCVFCLGRGLGGGGGEEGRGRSFGRWRSLCAHASLCGGDHALLALLPSCNAVQYTPVKALSVHVYDDGVGLRWWCGKPKPNGVKNGGRAAALHPLASPHCLRCLPSHRLPHSPTDWQRAQSLLHHLHLYKGRLQIWCAGIMSRNYFCISFIITFVEETHVPLIPLPSSSSLAQVVQPWPQQRRSRYVLAVLRAGLLEGWREGQEGIWVGDVDGFWRGGMTLRDRRRPRCCCDLPLS